MDNDEDLLRGMKRSPLGLLGGAMVLVVVPFAISYAVNELDYVKLGGGVLASLFCLIAFVRAFQGAHRARDVALSLLLFLVAVFHVATSGILGAVGFNPFGMRESDAREWLAARGDEVLSLEHEGERFRYTVIHEGQRCSGSLAINRSFSGTNTSNVERCGVAASNEDLLRECATGHAQSCQDLGVRLNESNPEEALGYFRRGCEGGIASACTNAGRMLQLSGDITEAITMSERACTMGDLMGCGNVGALLIPAEGEVSEEVAARALAHIEQACSGGIPLACGNLAWELTSGRTFPRDRARARGLFAIGCEGNIFTSCADLAILFRDGNGGPADVVQALNYARRACDGGQLSISCRMVGQLLSEQSEGYNAPALAAFRHACQLDDNPAQVSGACVQAGFHLFRHVEPMPLTEIVALWTRACELGNSGGCLNMGLLHRDGTLGAPNPEATVSFLRRACQLGDEAACREPGVQAP